MAQTESIGEYLASNKPRIMPLTIVLILQVFNYFSNISQNLSFDVYTTCMFVCTRRSSL